MKVVSRMIRNNEKKHNEKVGIYIHIPFCKQKCTYCDFYSKKFNTEIYNKYIDALINQIQNEYIIDDKTVKNNITIDTIFFGGGTPSILEIVDIQKILKTIQTKYILDKDIEITIECNPESITEEKVKKYKETGINRVSIGLQTADDRLLKSIGRIHTYQQFEYAYDIVSKYFKNINVDLMYALPTQTTKNLEDTLKKVIDKNPTHISLYSLILSEKTKMYQDIQKNKYNLDTDEEEKQIELAQKILKQNNYLMYEVSNYAKKGYECKHNLNCWMQKNYIGYGVSSASYLGNLRISTIRDINRYIDSINGNTNTNIVNNKLNTKLSNNLLNNSILNIEEKQSLKDYIIEKHILGLRTKYGISYFLKDNLKQDSEQDLKENLDIDKTIIEWKKEYLNKISLLYNNIDENININKNTDIDIDIDIDNLVKEIIDILEKYIKYDKILKKVEGKMVTYILKEGSERIQNILFVDILEKSM
ncbi:MAG: radical SAM family heme chaperone HemW [Clostridium sp.]